MVYALIIWILLYILKTLHIHLNHRIKKAKMSHIEKIKKYISENGLLESIIQFEEYVNHRPFLVDHDQYDRKRFFDKTLSYAKQLDEYILQPQFLDQIYTWDIKQCVYVLELIKFGTKLHCTAEWADERIRSGKSTNISVDLNIIHFENLKHIKILSEPTFLDAVFIISGRAEKRLVHLLDNLYHDALDKNDIKTAVEIYVSKSFCFYGLLDIWSREEYHDSFFCLKNEQEVLRRTGIEINEHIIKKSDDIIASQIWKKYLY